MNFRVRGGGRCCGGRRERCSAEAVYVCVYMWGQTRERDAPLSSARTRLFFGVCLSVCVCVCVDDRLESASIQVLARIPLRLVYLPF